MADDKTDLSPEVRDKDFVALPIGTIVGRYEITSILGRGGFGITYRARDTQLGRDVAIKEYLPTALAIRHDGITVMPSSTKVAEDFTWGRQRFVEEGRTLASLHRAPAIVRVHDFLETNGTAYIVMELVPGDTLEHRLRAGPLSAPDVDTLLWPLLEGLEQVHDEGFLHRDIKPANILLDDKGRPTLIDFGASRAAMVGRTTAMTAVFTPGYAAAEQMTSARLGPWTDIYGLSATLYHAITGNTPPSAFDRMLEDEYVPLLSGAPAGFSRGLLAGIDAGLGVRAADRPQTIADWRPLLRQADPLGAATIVLPRRETAAAAETPAMPPRAKAARAQRRRPAFWAALAAAIVAIVGGGAFLAKPLLQGTAVQSMTAEELARALEERQRADAAAVEKKQLEEEAQRQADADAEAKQKADDALAAAQQQRQKAEDDLANLKADMETRRQEEAARREQAAAAAQRALDEAAEKNKAEAEMAALRKADEEAKARAAAEAEAKKQADEEAQRQAEAEAEASRKAEEDARRKAAAEADAQRKADEALAKAQAERQKAEEAAAQQKADMEARQQTEAAAKAQSEADAQAKTEAAEQAKAEAEAKKKAEDDAAAERKAAEAAETGLKIGLLDRQHLQVALTAAGFDTHGADGAFGPQSREMIAAWQKKRNEPETGFLTAAQQQALLDSGVAAIRKYDDEQKKIAEDAKKKADDDAKAKAAVEAGARPAPPSNRPPPGQAALSGNLGRRVGAGVEIMVGFHANWTEECISKQPPVVDLTTPPKNGHVSIRITSDRATCGKVVQGIGVFYTGNPGFTGSDSFSYDRRGGSPTTSGLRTVTLQVVP